MEDIAIIKTGGKQYKVTVGDIIKVEKIAAKAQGDKLEFKDLLSGKLVTAEILDLGKYPKVIVYKFKAKKRYQRTQGHRQQYCQIKILAIKSSK